MFLLPLYADCATYYASYHLGNELFSAAYGRVHGHPAVSVNNAESSHNQERQAEDESGHSQRDQHQQRVGAAELQQSLEEANRVQHVEEANAPAGSADERHNLAQLQQ